MSATLFNLALYTKNKRIITEILGTEINEEETKMLRLKKKFTKSKVQLREYVFNEIDTFKYLEVMIGSKRESEMK